MNIHCHNHTFNTGALRAILKAERMTHFLILSGSAFHMNGYANEFLTISRVTYGNVTKLVDVEFLVSLIATSLQIVMQYEI